MAVEAAVEVEEVLVLEVVEVEDGSLGPWMIYGDQSARAAADGYLSTT